LNKTEIAKKYSKSLINTVEVSEISKIIEDLKVFSRLIETHRKLNVLFMGHIFTQEEKERALNEIFPYLQVSPHTQRFLKYIIREGDVGAIEEIIKALIKAYNEKLKKTSAVVISPIALERNHIDRLKNILKDLTDREVEIENRLDPSLLGGFIIKVDSTVYDSSLKGQLQLLKAELIK